MAKKLVGADQAAKGSPINWQDAITTKTTGLASVHNGKVLLLRSCEYLRKRYHYLNATQRATALWNRVDWKVVEDAKRAFVNRGIPFPASLQATSSPLSPPPPASTPPAASFSGPSRSPCPDGISSPAGCPHRAALLLPCPLQARRQQQQRQDILNRVQETQKELT